MRWVGLHLVVVEEHGDLFLLADDLEERVRPHHLNLIRQLEGLGREGSRGYVINYMYVRVALALSARSANNVRYHGLQVF